MPRRNPHAGLRGAKGRLASPAMDFRDTAEEASFRDEVRTWFAASLPGELHGHRGGAARFDGPEVRSTSRRRHGPRRRPTSA
jgi:hypothetical protein